MLTEVGFLMSDSGKIYSKPPLAPLQQRQLLESRGLVFQDAAAAEKFLKYNNYYRFSAYTYVFEFANVQGAVRQHRFAHGTTFERIQDLYQFDCELRNHLLKAIEKLEVGIKTALCLELALFTRDSHWYMDAQYFQHWFNHNDFLDLCEDEFQSSQETFVQHYKNTYSDPYLPPSWMMIEILSFGSCSKLISGLRTANQRKVAHQFDLPPEALVSWCRALVYIRNLCAHHARLWNRHFVIAPFIPKGKRLSKYMQPTQTFSA